MAAAQGSEGLPTEAWLAAIIASSDDAIISKNLDGIITSWNRAAERLLGYTATEAIGRHISMLAPTGREGEMTEILRRIRRGEQVDHFDTIRRRKDGQLVNVSLTVSPIRNAAGEIVGASKIARDITARKAAEEKQRLLLTELSHRVKNMLASVQSIAQRSLTPDRSIEEGREALLQRLQALAHTHDLLTKSRWEGASLAALVGAELAPYSQRTTIAGEDVTLTPSAALTLGLILHELATNAAKYGAFSRNEGQVDLGWTIQPGADGPLLHLVWREQGGPAVQPPRRRGFGRQLIEGAVAHNLQGDAKLEFAADGVRYDMTVPLAAITS